MVARGGATYKVDFEAKPDDMNASHETIFRPLPGGLLP
jgi:hypothetical protein